MDTIGAHLQMQLIILKKHGPPAMVDVVGTMGEKVIVRLLIQRKDLSGIIVNAPVSAIVPMENLPMITKQTYRYCRIIFVPTSPVGISMSEIQPDLINGGMNLIHYWL